MHRGLAYCVAGLLVVAALVAPAAGAGTPDGALVVAQEEFDSDQVSLTAALEGDGDAAWTFTYRMRLETDNETAAFESLQADIEANESAYTERFRDRIRATVSAAENATGREMSVDDVSVTTRVNTLNEESLGVVEYAFSWSAFAATDGERVVAGDALEGFYLNNETSLQFVWPEQYAAASVAPPADVSSETSARWNGPVEFGPDQPRVVVAPSESVGTTTDSGTATGTTDPGTGTESPPGETTAGGNTSGSVLFPVLVGALAAAVVLGGAGWLYWRRETGPADGDGSGLSAGDGGAVAGGAGGGVGEASDSKSSGEGATPPEELLSNEERVERFLREQGGRAKQQDVVDAMGWTEAKTSQVVKEMRENDDLESFRIGRENVLKLPDADDIDDVDEE